MATVGAPCHLHDDGAGAVESLQGECWLGKMLVGWRLYLEIVFVLIYFFDLVVNITIHHDNII